MTRPDKNDNLDSHTIQNIPDFNTLIWKRWMFKADRVLRLARFHIIFQRVKPEILEDKGDNPSLTIRGAIYFIDEKVEMRLGRYIIPVYLVGLLFIAGMIKMAVDGNHPFSIACFFLAFLTFDGFVPFALGRFAGETRESEIKIPFEACTRVIFFPKRGTFLIGWNEPKYKSAVFSFTLGANMAERMYERMREKIPSSAQIKSIDSADPGNPPPAKDPPG
jgi:hypothetical protein